MQRPVNKAVYFKLLEVARWRDLITYSEVSKIARVAVRSSTFWQILDDINIVELSAGRPMLSAVVVAQESGIPGEGFFKQAKAFGRQLESQDDRLFWREECNRIYTEFTK
jgi:hypothetical protein